MNILNDGGPAFPRPISTDEHTSPCNIIFEQQGMSLRDYFAGQALAGLLADSDVDCPASRLAESCYSLADAMLAARAKGGSDV